MTFNKREFARFIADRFKVSQSDGLILFDEIGQKMKAGLSEGESVFLFGLGTLKTVKSKGVAGSPRTRFRPTTREAVERATVTLAGLPGVAAAEIFDAVSIRSSSAGVRALQAGRACTAVTNKGTITLYQDDSGAYRCVFERRGGSKEESILHSKAAATTWLKQTFRLITE